MTDKTDKVEKAEKTEKTDKMVIYSRKVALELVNKGFLIVRTEIGEKTGKIVYLFNKTEEFDKAFNEIMHGRKKYSLNLLREEIDIIVKSLGSQITIEKLNGNKDESERLLKFCRFVSSALEDKKE